MGKKGDYKGFRWRFWKGSERLDLEFGLFSFANNGKSTAKIHTDES